MKTDEQLADLGIFTEDRGHARLYGWGREDLIPLLRTGNFLALAYDDDPDYPCYLFHATEIAAALRLSKHLNVHFVEVPCVH